MVVTTPSCRCSRSRRAIRAERTWASCAGWRSGAGSSTRLRAPPALAGALHHGILLERQAEFVTDALRAALLEWAGYETKVFEFISTEHTAKNLMIAATKRSGPVHRSEDGRRARDLAALYGIRQQRLATHLGLKLSPEAALT